MVDLEGVATNLGDDLGLHLDAGLDGNVVGGRLAQAHLDGTADLNAVEAANLARLTGDLFGRLDGSQHRGMAHRWDKGWAQSANS